MRPIKPFFIIALTLLGEAGVSLVLCNARPDAPRGFYLWFGSLTVLLPVYAAWMLRKMPPQRNR